MSKYFPKLRPFEGNVKVELYLSNYVTTADIKNATCVDTSKFAKKVDWSNLKREVDTLDVCKLKTNPVDLSKLSDVVKREVVKKNVYDKLV